jgi:hypothetical protein
MMWFKKLFTKVINEVINETYKFNGQIGDCTGRHYHTNDEQEAKYLDEGFYTRDDGYVVCMTCGGNCGQCGRSWGRGVPASMQSLVDNLYSNNVIKLKNGIITEGNSKKR